MDKKRIYLSCPTMHGEEQEFVKEAFDTNWVAPVGPHVNAFEKELRELNVNVKLNSNVKDIQVLEDNRFIIKLENNEKIEA